MNLFTKIVLGLLLLLSFSAGTAKLTGAPQELQFFASVGMGPVWMYLLGGLQVTGAVAGVWPKTRRLGLAGIAIGFVLSAIMIFTSGNTVFGMISLLPAILTLALLNRPGPA